MISSNSLGFLAITLLRNLICLQSTLYRKALCNMMEMNAQKLVEEIKELEVSRD